MPVALTLVAGSVIVVAIFVAWAVDGFGALGHEYTTAIGFTLVAVGTQVILGSFFIGLLTMRTSDVSLGRAVRTRLGRFEAPVSDVYRARFIDLDACADAIADAAPASTILEIGCGDGQLATRLLDRFPDATYEGIDVAPEVGRLYDGEAGRARFRTVDSQAFREATAARFDLVVLVDVLHHVPVEARGALLDDVRELTAPGGTYVVKEWARSRTPAHLAAWASDRILTGDRVAYLDRHELRTLLTTRFPQDDEVISTVIPPRPNNELLGLRRR